MGPLTPALSSHFCLILPRPSVYFAVERRSVKGSWDSKAYQHCISVPPPPPASLGQPLPFQTHPFGLLLLRLLRLHHHQIGSLQKPQALPFLFSSWSWITSSLLPLKLPFSALYLLPLLFPMTNPSFSWGTFLTSWSLPRAQRRLDPHFPITPAAFLNHPVFHMVYE